jgi:hypothetical protein
MPAKARQGSAMSMASADSDPRTGPAITFLLSIQYPKMPMVSSMATAVKVVRKICMDTPYPFFIRDSSIFPIPVVGSRHDEPVQT